MPQDQLSGEMGGEAPKCCSCIIIALGANLTSALGTPGQTLLAALKMLGERGAVIRNTSPFYHTPAFPAGAGPDYVNAAAVLSAPWSARETLDVLHGIEAELGRERQQRWGQRCIDLDLIAWDDLVLPDHQTHAEWRDLPLSEQVGRTPDRLILPHPRLQDRAFVLVPMADVAPDWEHPVLKKSAKAMRDALSEADLQAVRLAQ